MMNAIRRIIKDDSGSETIEMCITTCMVSVFILLGLMIMSYILEYNQVQFATQNAARKIEVAGDISPSIYESTFYDAVGNSSDLYNCSISPSGYRCIPGTKHLQLKEIFTVTGSAQYRIPLINPGDFTGYTLTLPIRCEITGMSEVHWE